MDANRKKLVLGTLAVIEVISSALAWRDLARRPDDKIRGKKNLWRIFISMNPGNSLVYWTVGRRR